MESFTLAGIKVTLSSNNARPYSQIVSHNDNLYSKQWLLKINLMSLGIVWPKLISVVTRQPKKKNGSKNSKNGFLVAKKRRF